MPSDAAHLALPFAGKGADLVMYDGAEVSKAIAASLCVTEAALPACKRNLFPPSAPAAVEADRDLKLCFGNNAPQSQLDLFTNNQPVK
jgi:2-polyprenyl-6-methoxyphenol hydroxylase-like FAD-dependent oxidoreductase